MDCQYESNFCAARKQVKRFAIELEPEFQVDVDVSRDVFRIEGVHPFDGKFPELLAQLVVLVVSPASAGKTINSVLDAVAFLLKLEYQLHVSIGYCPPIAATLDSKEKFSCH